MPKETLQFYFDDAPDEPAEVMRIFRKEGEYVGPVGNVIGYSINGENWIHVPRKQCRITKIFVTKGQTIKQGDDLYEIDDDLDKDYPLKATSGTENWRVRPPKKSTLSYEKLICDIAQLPHPDDMQKAKNGESICFGSFRPLDTKRAVEKFIETLRQKLLAVNEQFENRVLTEEELGYFKYQANKETKCLRDLLNQTCKVFGDSRGVLSYVMGGYFPLEYYGYEEYLGNKKNLDRFYGQQDSIFPFAGKVTAEFDFYLNGCTEGKTTKDWAGYMYYLRHSKTDIFNFLNTCIPAHFPEKDAQEHTYITGTTGAGKSELLKLLIHERMKAENCSVVLIDPHGTIARQVGQWKEFAEEPERLVYIDPWLDENKTPTVNPFDVKGLDDQQMHVIEQQILSTLQEVLTEQGTGLTGNMMSLLGPCVSALLRMGGRSLKDLRDFFGKDNNPDTQMLLLKAVELYRDDHDERDFFERELVANRINATKDSIRRRFRTLLGQNGPLFTGQSTIDLEDLTNQKKVIVFNLAKGRMGPASSKAFGRFIVAQLQALAMRRGQHEDKAHVPVHVVIDECHNYLTESIRTILTEARKFKVHLTLAQQMAGQEMGDGLKDAVLSMPAVQLTGFNDDHSTYRRMAEKGRVDMDYMLRLQKHEWAVSWGRAHPMMKVHPFTYLLDNSNAMSAEDWEMMKVYQLEQYYKPRQEEPETPEGEGPTRPSQPKATEFDDLGDLDDL